MNRPPLDILQDKLFNFNIYTLWLVNSSAFNSNYRQKSRRPAMTKLLLVHKDTEIITMKETWGKGYQYLWPSRDDMNG